MRNATIAALLAALCLPSIASAQEAPATPPARADIIKAAADVMQRARYCALVTIGEDGQPQARVVDAFAPEGDLTVWIATKPVTRKVAQIRADPRVTLFYFDAGDPGYVTLIGTAELVTDAAAKRAHWKPAWAGFYEDEYRGDDYLLIRVTPRRLEISSARHKLTGDPDTWRPVIIDFQ
jgi:PPOX class probable F420-dependent enzyme